MFACVHICFLIYVLKYLIFLCFVLLQGGRAIDRISRVVFPFVYFFLVLYFLIDRRNV